MGLGLPLLSLAAVLFILFVLPPLRVENGSVDSCDPVRTYGELTTSGLKSLLDLVGPLPEEAAFLDIGSGHGNLPMWACSEGGFQRCIGIELKRDRHIQAMRALADLPELHDNVTLLIGDASSRLDIFHGVHVVYWNNLCYSTEVATTIARNFVAAAPIGARLYALAPLPNSVPRLLHLGQHGGTPLEVDWREEAYNAYEYTHTGSKEQDLAEL